MTYTVCPNYSEEVRLAVQTWDFLLLNLEVKEKDF